MTAGTFTMHAYSIRPLLVHGHSPIPNVTTCISLLHLHWEKVQFPLSLRKKSKWSSHTKKKSHSIETIAKLMWQSSPLNGNDIITTAMYAKLPPTAMYFTKFQPGGYDTHLFKYYRQPVFKFLQSPSPYGNYPP